MDCKFVVVDIYGESGIEELGSELRKGTDPSRIQFSPVPADLIGDEERISECRFQAWTKVGIQFSREEGENTSTVHSSIIARVRQLLPPEDLANEALDTINWKFQQMAQFYKPYE